MRIVRGNDIKIVWKITKLEGEINVPESFNTANNIQIRAICLGKILDIEQYNISGNTIAFTIKGREFILGDYNLELIYEKEYDARVVYRGAFTIVDNDAQASYVPKNDLEIITFDLYSSINTLHTWQLLDVITNDTQDLVEGSLQGNYLGYDAASKKWRGMSLSSYATESYVLEEIKKAIANSGSGSGGGSTYQIITKDQIQSVLPTDINLYSAAAVKQLLIDSGGGTSYWELKTDLNGVEYLYTDRPVVSASDIIAYSSETPLLPSVYEDIPIDNITIYWDGEVLRSRGGGETPGGLNLVQWGTEVPNKSVELSVTTEDVTTTKNLALAGHTHEFTITSITSENLETEEATDDNFYTALATKMLIEDTRLWELKTDAYGVKYLYTTMNVVSARDMIAYSGVDVLVPSVYADIPIDNDTIYWEGGILKAQGGGSGGGSSVSWGVTSNAHSPLTVNDVTKTVALEGHTHSQYMTSNNYVTRANVGTSSTYGLTTLSLERSGLNAVTVSLQHNHNSSYAALTHYHDILHYNKSSSYPRVSATSSGASITGTLVASGDVVAYVSGSSSGLQAAFKYWKPSVNSSGVLSWENSTSTTAPSSANIKGPAGETFNGGSISNSISFTNSGTVITQPNTGISIRSNLVSGSYVDFIIENQYNSTNSNNGITIQTKNNTQQIRLSAAGTVYIKNLVEQTSSDMRGKNVVSNVENVLEKIKDINVFKYTSKHNEDGRVQYGVSAQEVDNVFPEIVYRLDDYIYDGEEGLALDYKYLALIIGVQGVKELYTLVQTQQKEIDELKNKILQ